jgi:hypothetical protein
VPPSCAAVTIDWLEVKAGMVVVVVVELVLVVLVVLDDLLVGALAVPTRVVCVSVREWPGPEAHPAATSGTASNTQFQCRRRWSCPPRSTEHETRTKFHTHPWSGWLVVRR